MPHSIDTQTLTNFALFRYILIKSSVIVGLSGGLGNQLFQYAAGRSLSQRLDVPLVLDLDWFQAQKERSYGLGAFMIDGEQAIPFLKLPALVSRASRRWARKRFGVEVFRERQFHFESSFVDLDVPVYLEGYWQSERYFQSYEKEIRSDLRLVNELPAKCHAIRDLIRKTDAICLHIRRGDYVKNSTTASIHGSCSLDYYQKGLAIVSKDLENPHCFLFSDDPQWVKENLSMPVPMTVVDINNSSEVHWDLDMMRQCKHFVIANSSLSWWGAWLSENPTKVVVAPERWFQSDKVFTGDLIPDLWKRI